MFLTTALFIAAVLAILLPIADVVNVNALP